MKRRLTIDWEQYLSRDLPTQTVSEKFSDKVKEVVDKFHLCTIQEENQQKISNDKEIVVQVEKKTQTGRH